MKNRFTHIAAVYLIVKQGESVLLGLRKNTGYKDGCWVVPSGHVEAGESILQAVIRETKEELAMELLPSEVTFCSLLHRSAEDGSRLDIFFSFSYDGRQYKNAELDKCEKLAWFNCQSLPPNTVDYIIPILTSLDAIPAYTDLGWSANQSD